MSLARRSLMEVAAARFGWRHAYGDTAQVDALLTEQTEAAYTDGAHHAALATAKNDDALAVQPGALDVRRRVLDDVLYLEGLLAGARNRNLPAALIERLEDAVDHGHELTVLLADTVRTTAAVHAATAGSHG
ncbi:hypothetical protein [Streptomyces candidus]|uniref:Uncharacterized protein n=1 Tax=Streptomyces candidus TaxID=67283 RepID=A0A7X0LSB9_9ACTN|nr:hypothetical protein [Streptomyces candidus]MBB6439095.1 hypothetical protein [Streptomyces candidus]GHH55620.1 hypothetical protein GCM10018773_60360 [Streptomyces candidus]